jgi:hypothetical protein
MIDGERARETEVYCDVISSSSLHSGSHSSDSSWWEPEEGIRPDPDDAVDERRRSISSRGFIWLRWREAIYKWLYELSGTNKQKSQNPPQKMV